MTDARGFERIYLHTVDDVFRHWNPEMQAEVALHNVGWAPDRHDFRNYLKASLTRYKLAYESLSRQMPDLQSKSICDVGGFWGVWPVTLARLGADVTMTEALRYFGGAFGGLFDFIGSQGVEIVDFDPFEGDEWTRPARDVVTLMAVLEHYPHSLRSAMERVLRILRAEGLMLVEVPNIAYWPWRVALLKGKSPLVPIADVFGSAVPFTGHHREFTREDLRSLASLSGLDILEEHSFNYSPGSWTFTALARRPMGSLIERVAWRWFPDTREVLMMTCRRGI